MQYLRTTNRRRTRRINLKGSWLDVVSYGPSDLRR